MKFTKTAFRTALKANDQTKVWHLAAVKFGCTPSKKEVYDLVKEIADTIRDDRKAYAMAYESQRKQRIQVAETMAWYRRGAYGQYGDSDYKTVALKMLRKLYTEPFSTYSKIANFGHTHLYFCSPIYGHADYNKVCTCPLNGPLATDANGNKYDPQAVWCNKVLALSNRIYDKKREAYDKAV